MQEKKNALIVVNSFNIGGTVSSLYTLISMVDTQKVHIDIFARNISGFYIDKLPNCTLLPENLWLSYTIYKKNFLVRMAKTFLFFIRKVLEIVGVDMFLIYNHIGGKQLHTENYDAVIGFDESLSRYISALPARKRINWIHCDYRRYVNGKDESCYYDKIDTVVCVSEFAKGIFCEYYPKYANKTVAIHNIINVEDLHHKASKPIDDERFYNDCFTIVSCGRMDPVKQFHLIPFIVDRIRKNTDKPFHWYIIGGGNEEVEKHIEQEIEQYKVSNYVKLLGMKTNPYNYMAKSNLYVCTSWSESYPMVVNEAKALGLPVVCNIFPSASESVHDGVNGFILDIENMPDVIASMIEKPLEIENYQSENDKILESFYSLL